MATQMPKEAATKFFSELFYGEHHLPSELKEFGYGWCVHSQHNSFATTDFNELTRLVLLSHRDAIRAEISAIRNGVLRIAIWQREREGALSTAHPTIEQAIESFNKYKHKF